MKTPSVLDLPDIALELATEVEISVGLELGMFDKEFNMAQRALVMEIVRRAVYQEALETLSTRLGVSK